MARRVDGLTYEAVGERVGMNRAQVRYHFREKAQLLDRSIEYVIAVAQSCILKRAQGSRSWQQKVTSIAEGFFDWMESNPTHGAVRN